MLSTEITEKPKRTKTKNDTSSGSGKTRTKRQKSGSETRLSHNVSRISGIGIPLSAPGLEGRTSCKVDPSDFMTFMRFACGQFEIDVSLIFEVKFEEWKTGKEKKLKARSSLASSSSIVQTDVADPKLFKSYGSNGGRVPVKIDLSFNMNDKLQRIEIKERVPREIINLIGLIGVYHPMLFSISIKGVQNKNVIYEISRLLTLTNITEIILDCVVNECGNYYVILDNPGMLTCFTVTRCGVNDLVLKEMVNRLKYGTPASKVVKYLNLSCNMITDKGALYLADLLKTNVTIFYLNLSGNQITDKGAVPILNSLMEFQITKQEFMDSSRMYFDYLNEKCKAVKQFINAVRLDPRQKDGKLDKIKRITPKRVPVKVKSSKNDNMDLHQQLLLAEQALKYPAFDHAYQKARLISRSKHTYCIGNTSLTGLNLAYNNLTQVSIKKIRDVIDYKNTLVDPKFRVLVRISVEGNLLAPSIDLTAIDSHVESYFVKTKDQNLKVIKSTKSTVRSAPIRDFSRILGRD